MSTNEEIAEFAKRIYDTLEEENTFFPKVKDQSWEELDEFVQDFYIEMSGLTIKASYIYDKSNTKNLVNEIGAPQQK